TQQHTAIVDMLQPQLRKDEVDIEPALAHRAREAVRHEIVGAAVGRRQQHEPQRRTLARARGTEDERSHGGCATRCAAVAVTPSGAARSAANSSASSVPGATVMPRSASTGTLEEASTPKAMTVARFATASEASVRGTEPCCGSLLALSKKSAEF